MLFHYPVWAGKHWRFFSKSSYKKSSKDMPCQHQSTRQNQHRFALKMKLQNPRIRLFIGVFVAKIYGRGNLSRIADGAEWLLLEVISLSQSGDNLQNVRSNRDLLLQSPEVTLTTGRPPPSWQPCHYMAYHHHPARQRYEHK